MRNLKRALSLAVSTVMLVGMMAVGTSAASYADVTSEHNEEAIGVMQAVSVMVGDENGNFNPDKNVTRAEMAVVMANLLDLQVEDFVGATLPFTDVPEWARAYVAACYADGITGGVSATEYGSNYSVTSVQAALMMLKALGYFQYAQDFGTDWQVATIRQASQIDLFDGINSSRNAAMTRNEVAQIALNALESVMVESDGTTTTITTGDITINTGDTKYEDRTNSIKYDQTADENDGKLYLCENLYGNDLKKVDDEDNFQRPGYGWEYEGDQVAFVADEPLVVFEDADALDADAFDDEFEDWDTDGIVTYYNGAQNDRTYDYFYEKKGVTVEFYGDSDEEIVDRAVVVEGYVAQVDTIDTNDDDEVTSVDVIVYEASKGGAGEVITIDADADEDAYALIADLDEDDVFMAFLKPGWDVSDDGDDLLAVDDVETIEGEVSTISADSGYNGWVRIDGTRYDFAWEYSQADVERGSDGVFYLYNGYIVHFDGDANNADDEYLYVVRANTQKGQWDNDYYAEVVFPDGTAEVVDITEKSYTAEMTGVYEYDYDEDDDIYTLTPVDTEAGSVTIERGNTKIGGSATANGRTVFVSVNLDDDGAFDDASVYTGYRNVPSMKSDNAYLVYAEDSTVAEYVFVINGTISSSNDDVIYLAGASASNLVNDKDLGEYYTYNAVVGGEIVEIMVAADADVGERDVAHLSGVFNVTAVNDDGVYTTVDYDAESVDMGDGDNFGREEDEVIKIDGVAFAYTDDVQVFVADKDGDITEGSINRNYSNVDLRYILNDDGEVSMVFIQRQ